MMLVNGGKNMEWICLLFPACLAVKIRCERREELSKESVVMLILRWIEWVLLINILTMVSVLVAFGFSEVLTESFHSFSFSLKYMLVSILFSIVLPYVVEIKEKYFEISVKIEGVDMKVS